MTKTDVEETADSSLTGNIPAGQATILRWLLFVASGLLVAGIILPMITISKFVFIQNSFSVLSGVIQLLHDGQIILFIVVTSFSIILPIIKIWILLILLSKRATDSPKIQRYLHLMHEYGRWAMLDVMVVAVLIVTVKLGAIASVQVHTGLFVFGAAVLLIMLITTRVVYLRSLRD